MSQLEVDKVIPQSGTTLTLGESGDTITIASGATFTPTLTAPIIDEINDNNGNEEIIFTTTTSAVNELTIANAATGNAPEIAATGDDTDIDLKLTPKGAGNLVLDGIEFPNADGSAGEALVTDGSGVLSFSAVGAAAGQVIQVVSTTKTDVFGLLGTSTFTDITGLSVSITPSSASNKILVLVNVASGQSATSVNAFRLVRGATAIGGGTASGSRQSAFATGQGVDTNGQFSSSFNYLDSPSTTSSTTYKIQMICNDTAGVNQTRLDTDISASYGSRTSSTITVMEIKG